MKKEVKLEGDDAVLELVKTLHYAISDLFTLIDEWKWQSLEERIGVLDKVIAKMDRVNVEMMLCLGSISHCRKELRRECDLEETKCRQ